MRYTPEQNDAVARANREAAHAARNQTQAFAVKLAADDLVAALERSGGKYSTAASHRLLDLCNAAYNLFDADLEGCREGLMADLGCDEHGNPLPPEESDLVRWPSGSEITALVNRSYPA